MVEWSIGPDRSKSAEQRLYDIGFAMIAMLEFADYIDDNAGDNRKQASLRQLFCFCRELHERMEVWYERFLQESPSPLYWTTTEATPDYPETSDNYPFAAPLQFPNLRVALTTVMLWALQLVLSSTINLRLLLPWLSQIGAITEDLDIDFHTKYSVSFMLDVAGNIARSVPYLMRPHMGTVASQRLLFPLRIAMGVFQARSGPALPWCKCVFGKIATEKGIRFGQGIADVLQIWGVSEEQERMLSEGLVSR